MSVSLGEKCSCVVVWDLSEAEKQLGDKSIYKDISFNDKILRDLVETNNKMFLNFKKQRSISEKEMKYFVYDYKKASMRNYTFSLKSIRDFLMFQVYPSYLVVGPIPRELL